jgi:hypothetical protein
MHVQVNTDHNIQGDERLIEVVEGIVSQGLKSVASRLTRVEVHLKDTNGPKGGNDIHATIEARPEGMRPYAVTEKGSDIPHTVKLAAKTLAQRLDSEIGKRSRKRP